MKKVGKILVRVLAGLLGLVLLVGAFTIFSPWPASMLVRLLFRNAPQRQPADYASLQSKVLEVSDIEYPSQWKDNKLDFYYPKEAETAGAPVPIILWVHGGAFVGGDKTDISIYSNMLAANGYAVASMNYRLAPEGEYPIALRQVAEVCEYLETLSAQYPFDLNKLVIAGDSAGANFVAQFVQAQSDAVFAQSIGVPQVVSPENIAALLLYCGPYNLDDIIQLVERGGVLGFIGDRIGWGMFNDRKWVQNPATDKFSAIKYAGAHFPPTFVTDGSAVSFEDQGKELVVILEEAGVPVESLFFPKEQYETNHEYQFLLDTEPGRICRERTLEFLAQYVK